MLPSGDHNCKNVNNTTYTPSCDLEVTLSCKKVIIYY